MINHSEKFWSGFEKRALTKLAGVELYAVGVRHNGNTDIVADSHKLGPYHLFESIEGAHDLHDEGHFDTPKNHKQIRDYARSFKDSVLHYGNKDHKEELNSFADDLHKASKNKKYKHFKLRMG